MRASCFSKALKKIRRLLNTVESLQPLAYPLLSIWYPKMEKGNKSNYKMLIHIIVLSAEAKAFKKDDVLFEKVL